MVLIIYLVNDKVGLTLQISIKSSFQEKVVAIK